MENKTDNIPEDELEQVTGGIPNWMIPLLNAMGIDRFSTMTSILASDGREAAYDYTISVMGPDFGLAGLLKRN